MAAVEKEKDWFKHYVNERETPKIVELIEQLELEGYGIYWVLLEVLRDQPGYRYPLSCVNSLARKYATTAEKMKTVIFNYDLFVIDEEDFFSPALIKRMTKYEEVCEQNSQNAKKGWEKRKNKLPAPEIPTSNAGALSSHCDKDAGALHSHCDNNAGVLQSQSECNANRINQIIKDQIKKEINQSIDQDIDDDKRALIQKDLIEKNELSSFCLENKAALAYAINFLSKLDTGSNEPYYKDPAKQTISEFCINALIEMAMYGNPDQGSAAIIKKINDTIKKDDNHDLFTLIDMVSMSYLNRCGKTTITDPKRYMQTSIINGFETYRAQFQSEIMRINNNGGDNT